MTKYGYKIIDAPGYMVIHCLWVVGKHKTKGFVTKLLEHCLKDAHAQGMGVVAVVVTEGNFLAGRKIFLRTSLK